MEVKNIRWIGVHTQQYDEMVGFLGDVMGLPRNFEEPATVEFKTTEGDEVQVMGPGHPYFDFFGRHATGPVPLFEVDDLADARRRLVQARIEIVGPTGRDSHWEWLHFRAPDGHLYELVGETFLAILLALAASIRHAPRSGTRTGILNGNPNPSPKEGHPATAPAHPGSLDPAVMRLTRPMDATWLVRLETIRDGPRRSSSSRKGLHRRCRGADDRGMRAIAEDALPAVADAPVVESARH